MYEVIVDVSVFKLGSFVQNETTDFTDCTDFIKVWVRFVIHGLAECVWLRFVKRPIDKSKKSGKVTQLNRDEFGFVSFFMVARSNFGFVSRCKIGISAALRFWVRLVKGPLDPGSESGTTG